MIHAIQKENYLMTVMNFESILVVLNMLIVPNL